jgi:PAS domain S-box-containing protein
MDFLLVIFNPAHYQFWEWNYYKWSALFVAFTNVVAIIILLIKKTRGRVFWAYFSFMVAVTLWGTSYFVWQSALTYDLALFWIRLLMVPTICATPILLWFALEFFDVGRIKREVILAFLTVYIIIFEILDATPLFIPTVEPIAGFRYWPVAGLAYTIFVLIWFAIAIYAIYILFVAYKTYPRGLLKYQAGFAVLGVFMSLMLGASTNYPLWWKIPVMPYTTPLVSIYVFMITYAILRFRLFNITPAVAASQIFSSMIDPLFIIDENGKILIVNKYAVEITGMTQQQLIGRSMLEFLPQIEDEVAAIKMAPIRQLPEADVLISGTESILKIENKKVSVSFSMVIVRGPAHLPVGAIIICHDISEIKDSMNIIKKQQAELEKQVVELEKFKKLTVDREVYAIKIKEENQALKEEVARLKK